MFSQRLLVDQLAATPVGLFGIPLLSSQQMVQPSSSGNSFMNSFPMPQVTQPTTSDALNSIAMSQGQNLSQNLHQNLSQSMSTSMISSSSNISSLSSQSHSRTVSVSSVDSKNSSSELSSQNVPIVTPNGCIEQQTQTDGDGDGDGDGNDTITSGISQQQLGTIGSANSSVDNSLLIKLNGNQPKRLHVSNIPFRFRDPDLRQLFGQFGPILDVEIIFNERGSKGFGFVTFANCLDADRARDQLDGTIVEGRKIEVNNATARVQAKKTSSTASGSSPSNLPNDTTAMSALRGVIQRGRARGTLAAALARHPSPLPITAPHVSLYQDPFLAYAAGTERAYQLPASYTANAAYQAAAARSYAAAAAVATQPVASYPNITGYTRDYTEPYLSHGIGPIASYGSIYRGGYNRFAPY